MKRYFEEAESYIKSIRDPSSNNVLLPEKHRFCWPNNLHEKFSKPFRRRCYKK
jgi:hypothetical protein